MVERAISVALSYEGDEAGYETSLPLSARQQAGVRELAEQIRPRLDSLVARMVLTYKAQIPQYAAITDPLVLADMKAVSLAGIRCWIEALDLARPIDEELLLPVLEARRRRALQGVGMDAMLRAYRIATHAVWQEILELPVDQELVAPLSKRMLEFVDRLTTATEEAHTTEALQASRVPAAGPSALFEAILADQYREQHHHADVLESDHCVVVLDVLPSTTRLSLDELAAGLVREAWATYWTTRHRSVLAACPVHQGGRRQLLHRLERFVHTRAPLGVAVGGVARGTTQIRQSHREALQALHIGGRLDRAATRVCDYQELAPLAALVADPEQARRFVQGRMESLGRLAERAWVLPTLASYLRHRGRLKAVAADLGVHHSTVKYRVNELRPFLESHVQDGDQAGTVLLAIRAHDYLTAERDPVLDGGTRTDNSASADAVHTRTAG
ncbi:PucR family transcriptional regulator [Stenotrophomonas sp. NPDC087984]